MTKREITQLSYAITGCAIKVHKALGPGLLESIYEKCMAYELVQNGYDVKQQLQVSVKYYKHTFDCNLKVDLFVNDCIVVELKTVETIQPIHEAQLITYMKLLKAPQGLLINFNTTNIVQSIRPFVNHYFKILQ